MYTIYSFIAGAYSVTYVGYTATAICISVTIPIYNVPLCLLILHNLHKYVHNYIIYKMLNYSFNSVSNSCVQKYRGRHYYADFIK